MTDLDQKTNIIVIDDDAGIRLTLSKILEKEGYSVTCVDEGKKALEMCEKNSFDVALIDIRLPDMDGTEVTERIKEVSPSTVKIIVTGFPSLQNAVEALDHGADGYVLKPFDARDLLRMISENLRKRADDSKFGETKVAGYVETRMRELER